MTLRKFLTTFIVSFLLFFLSSTQAFADNPDISDACEITVNNVIATTDRGQAPQASAFSFETRPDGTVNQSNVVFPITIKLGATAKENMERCSGATFRVAIYRSWALNWMNIPLGPLDGDTVSANFIIPQIEVQPNTAERDIDVEVDQEGSSTCKAGEPICTRYFVRFNGENVQGSGDRSCDAQKAAIDTYIASLPSKVEAGQTINVVIANIADYQDYCGSPYMDWSVTRGGDTEAGAQNTNGTFSFTPQYNGTHTLTITTYGMGAASLGGGRGSQLHTFTKLFCVPSTPGGDCSVPSPAPAGTDDEITAFSLCRQIPVLTQADIERQLKGVPENKRQQIGQELQDRSAKQVTEKAKCCQCAFGSSAVDPNGACAGEKAGVTGQTGFKPGLYTSLGCIGADSESIVTSLVRIGLGLAGGVGLLMILAGAFMFTTSQGEPKRASEAKELITSAVLGLIFIIFSVTLLQFIGVSILRIPGFGSP